MSGGALVVLATDRSGVFWAGSLEHGLQALPKSLLGRRVVVRCGREGTSAVSFREGVWRKHRRMRVWKSRLEQYRIYIATSAVKIP